MTIPFEINEINTFLSEDIGSGDITAAIIPIAMQATADVITRENMVVCGQAWFNAVFKELEPDLKINWLVHEGEWVKADSVLCQLQGQARSLLTGERTALNWLQTLSATASVARRYAEVIAGTGCKILDTRKTIPGLRQAQKYAVACGGCYNHRLGLYDGVLIKENHIIAAGSIADAVQLARHQTTLPVEIEVENLVELQEALGARPDRILLDNFNLEALKTAVTMTLETVGKGGVELEASGNLTLDNIKAVAETGVDYISIGALTKHIIAIDLSMRIKLERG